MNRWLKFLGAAALSWMLSACGGGSSPASVAELAQKQGLTALLAAADKAGLSPTLADPNARLTVFAPTNAAFDTLATQLGFANGTALVNALPPQALQSILLYHALPSLKSASDLAAGGASQATLYSFESAPASLGLNTSSGVKITDAALTTAKVVTPNLYTDNGIVHVVDKVLVPPGVLNVVQMAQVNPLFTSLVGAVVQAGLATTLSGAGPFTVFAPTNDAFTAIASTVSQLTVPELTTVLSYHVLTQQVLAADIPFGSPVSTFAMQAITINAGNPPTITDVVNSAPASKIIATNVRASNGVIHVIDKVLIPNLAM